MTESVERERLGLRRALTMGASRNPIETPGWLKTEKDSGNDLLSLIAALGLRSRFDRLSAPDKFQSIEVSHDPERMPPAAARAVLRRLYAAKKQSLPTAISLRTLDALAEADLCLHPFDYRFLASLMSADQTRLDKNARGWLSRRRDDPEEVPLADIDADNWTDFPPAERVDFLRRLRGRDPAQARELCAGAIGNDAAAVRGRLIHTMLVGLGPDDVELLQSIASDRAASVRKIATSLLARIEGTDEHKQRLENAHELLTLKTVSVIGRRKVLAPKIPKGTAQGKIAEWMDLTFGDVNPMHVAQALGMSTKKFAEALGNEQLRALFFAGAIDAGETELATLIAAELDTHAAWMVINAQRAHLSALDRERREQIWLYLGSTLDRAPVVESAWLMAQLYEVLRTMPPADTVEALAAPRRWKRWVNEAVRDEDPARAGDVPGLIISFCPSEQRGAWRERFGALPPALTSDSTALADLFDSIESSQST